MSEASIFDRMALIGVGLIGSSIARAARRGGLVNHIAATSRTETTRQETRDLGIVDSVHLTAAECVTGADLVIVCSHLGSYSAIGQEIGPVLNDGTVVTDVGSVKGRVFDDLGEHLPQGVHLIPSHPISGTEKSGPGAGFAELFDNRWWIITPHEDTDPLLVERLSKFFEGLGSKIEIMDPKRHDLVLAITSHLPHLIAYNIVGTADDLETVTQSEVIKYSAGGFRDFTRIAASDPEFWRDVFLNNREAVLEMLGRFTEDLIALQRSIRWRDGDSLEKLFSRTRKVRKSIVDAGQDTDAIDFGRRRDVPKTEDFG